MKLLEMKNVAYPAGPAPLLRDISLTIEAGDCAVLFGPSGSGKHALLKLAAGILLPGAGSVAVTGDAEAGALPSAYVAQDKGLISNLTLLQNAVLPLVYHGRLGYREALAQGRRVMADFALTDAADMRPAAAGAGRRRIAQLVRAVLIDPRLYLFERPFSDIDSAAELMIRRTLRTIKDRRDVGALIATGDPKKYLTWGSRFIYLEQGRPRFFANAEELANCRDPQVQAFLT
ncbi:MAG: ATP-binding cassette domain-containing protein [Elusimicrobiota bacterium]